MHFFKKNLLENASVTVVAGLPKSSSCVITNNINEYNDWPTTTNGNNISSLNVADSDIAGMDIEATRVDYDPYHLGKLTTRDSFDIFTLNVQEPENTKRITNLIDGWASAGDQSALNNEAYNSSINYPISYNNVISTELARAEILHSYRPDGTQIGHRYITDDGSYTESFITTNMFVCISFEFDPAYIKNVFIKNHNMENFIISASNNADNVFSDNYDSNTVINLGDSKVDRLYVICYKTIDNQPLKIGNIAACETLIYFRPNEYGNASNLGIQVTNKTYSTQHKSSIIPGIIVTNIAERKRFVIDVWYKKNLNNYMYQIKEYMLHNDAYFCSEDVVEPNQYKKIHTYAGQSDTVRLKSMEYGNEWHSNLYGSGYLRARIDLEPA